MRLSRPFVAVYTNECKEYCEAAFFSAIQALTHPDYTIHIVDNSLGMDYTHRLNRLCPSAHTIEHIDIDREPRKTLFHRNVAFSLAHLRDQFLATDRDYFVIFESDVIPPANVLELLEEVYDQADIIGGLYYRGFHPDEAFDPQDLRLVPVTHVLSGCALYQRAVIRKVPFRWDAEELSGFPDAFMSRDAVGAGFRLANYHKIKCRHLHAANGGRGLDRLR